MIDWYYKIWVDCILTAKSNPNNKNDWPYYTMIFMSMAMSGNSIVLMVALMKYVFHSDFYFIHINILPGDNLDNFLNFFVLYLGPILFLNYFLIFFNDRYKKILNKYKYYNGKLFATYFVCSLILPLMIIVTVYLLQ